MPRTFFAHLVPLNFDLLAITRHPQICALIAAILFHRDTTGTPGQEHVGRSSTLEREDTERKLLQDKPDFRKPIEAMQKALQKVSL